MTHSNQEEPTRIKRVLMTGLLGMLIVGSTATAAYAKHGADDVKNDRPVVRVDGPSHT